MAKLSLSLQNDAVPFSADRSNIEVAQAHITTKRNNPGTNVAKVLSVVTEDGGWLFKGIALKSNVNKVESFTEKSRQMLDMMITSITRRFSHFVNDPILQAADILDPCNYQSNTGDLLAYGNAQINHMLHLATEPESRKKLPFCVLSCHLI